MGTIRKPSDYGSGGSETSAFIQCINGRETQINELWCMGLDSIFREVHHIARVDILAGTIGEFFTNYLDLNGRRIAIIGKFSVNGSVQFLGFSDQTLGSGLPYIVNLLDKFDTTGCVISNNSNHIWRGCFKNSNNIINATWYVAIDASPTKLSPSPGRPCST